MPSRGEPMLIGHGWWRKDASDRTGTKTCRDLRFIESSQERRPQAIVLGVQEAHGTGKGSVLTAIQD